MYRYISMGCLANKYLSGGLNLDIPYQRQINSKFSVNVQPYLKMPLTNVVQPG